jgi:hypothetical protein
MCVCARMCVVVHVRAGGCGHAPHGDVGLEKLVQLDCRVLVAKIEIDALVHLAQAAGAAVHAVLEDQLLQVEKRALVIDLHGLPDTHREAERERESQCAWYARVSPLPARARGSDSHPSVSMAA